MSSGGCAIGNSNRHRKPKLLAITMVLKNRVQTPVDDRAVLNACEGSDKIAAIVN
jgi:hypothetical protein